MKKRVRLIALLVLAIITAALLWKFVPWAKLSAKYAAFSISDLPPVWYYSTVILLAVLLMVGIWFALQIIPKRQAHALLAPQKKVAVDGKEIDEEGSTYIPQSPIKPTELFSIENEARKTLSQIIGGFIVIVSLILTGANLAITSRLTQEGQITDRFTKAITQLGDKDKLEVRLGGIYALERIANDSEKDHWTIMEVLTAYVRENAPRREEKATNKTASKKNQTIEVGTFQTPPTDIQAILTLIGRRKAVGEPNEINLSNVNLSGAILRGANFRRANFNSGDLRKIYLTEADLREASFTRGILGAADFRGADLREAFFVQADLREARLNKANLERVNLQLANLQLADFRWTNLRGANLNGAILQNAILMWANFSGAILSGANLRSAFLHGADLREAKMLTWEQVSTAIIDDETKLPPEIENQHKDELKAMREKTRKEREAR